MLANKILNSIFPNVHFPTRSIDKQDKRLVPAQIPSREDLLKMDLRPKETNDFRLFASIHDAKYSVRGMGEANAIAYLLGYRDIKLSRTPHMPHEMDGMDSGLGMRASYYLAGAIDAACHNQPESEAIKWFPNFTESLDIK